MTITTGDTLPNATLLYMGDDGPASVELTTRWGAEPTGW